MFAAFSSAYSPRQLTKCRPRDPVEGSRQVQGSLRASRNHHRFQDVNEKEYQQETRDGCYKNADRRWTYRRGQQVGDFKVKLRKLALIWRRAVGAAERRQQSIIPGLTICNPKHCTAWQPLFRAVTMPAEVMCTRGYSFRRNSATGHHSIFAIV
jgi:hypothetical protein